MRQFAVVFLWMLWIASLASAAPTTGPLREIFPSYGFSVALPAGSVPYDEVEPGEDSVAAWEQTRMKPGNQQTRVEIHIWCEAAQGRSLKDLASTDVKEMGGGRIDPKPSTLDGLAAIHVIPLLKHDSKARIEQLLCIRDRYYFLIEVQTEPGITPNPTLEGLRTSWKWSAAQSPSQHLEALRKDVAFADGSALIDYPAVMRPHPSDDEKTMEWQATGHGPSGDAEFSVRADVAHLDEGTDLKQLRDRFGDAQAKSEHWPTPLTWTADPDQPNRWATPWEPIKFGGESGKGPAHTALDQLAVIDLGHGPLVSLDLIVPDVGSAEARKAYQQAAVQMVRSIRSVLTDGLVRYTSPDGSLSILYPRHWRVWPAAEIDTNLVSFDENRTPPTGHHIAVMSLARPARVLFALKDVINSDVDWRRQYGDVQVLSNESAKVAGQKGWRIAMDEVPKNPPLPPRTLVTYYLDVDNMRYEVSFSMSPEQYAWMKPVLAQIADSMRITR